MRNIFNVAYLPAPKRNKFPLYSKHDTTLDAGYIIPVDIRRVLPADTWTGDIIHKIRPFPLRAPAFQDYDVGWFVFFCPARLLMNNDNYMKHIESDEAKGLPYVKYSDFARYSRHFKPNIEGVEPQSLANYLGMPIWENSFNDGDPLIDDDTPINLGPFLAYQKIYDEWFRDENIIPSGWDDMLEFFGDGGLIEDNFAEFQSILDDITTLRHRAFRKDRFTSALPATQAGRQVVIPLGDGQVHHIPVQNVQARFRFGGTVDVDGSDFDQNILFGIQAASGATLNTTQVALGSVQFPADESLHSLGNIDDPNSGGPYVQIQHGDGSGVYVDISSIPGVEVNTWRSAVMMQTFFERLETCGSRYVEIIRGMYGVLTPDARLQRPELIKAWRSHIAIGDVIQTEQIDGESAPAGTLRGIAVGVGSGARFTYRSYEFGYLITLCSILPRQSYSQGLPKLFTDVDYYDLAWPLLAHQGEEPILNRELYFQPTQKARNEGVFGYQSRYYDWRSSYDRCSGLIAPFQSLDYWNGSRQFGNLPTLSAQFIECRWEDSDQDRLFPTEFYPGMQMGFFPATIFTAYKAWRPLPFFAIPATI